MLFALSLCVLSALEPTTKPRVGDRVYGRQRAADRGTPVDSAFFEFAPSNFRGLQTSSPNLCGILSTAEKGAGEYWCINGATAASDSTVTMTRTAAPAEEKTIYQCTGGANCYTMTGLRATADQSGGGGAFFRSAVLSGRTGTTTGSFTACAWVTNSVEDAYYIGLREDNSSSAQMRYDLGLVVNRNHYAYIANTTCGGGSSSLGTQTFAVDGTTSLVCARYDGTNASLWTDNAAGSNTAIGAQCAGGTNTRFVYGGLSTVAVNGSYLTKNGYILAGFHVSTHLDNTRLEQIVSSMRSNVIQSTKGQAISNARSTPIFCAYSDNTQGTWLKAGETCMSGGKMYKSREATNSMQCSSWIDPGCGWSTNNATITANAAVGPDNIKDAEGIAFTNGTTSYIAKTGSTCPTGASVVSFWVAPQNGVAGEIRTELCQGGTCKCADCAYTATGFVRCQNALTFASGDTLRIGYENAASGCTAHAAFTNNPLYIWGLQCELDVGGGKATPYIATRFGSVTRTADKPYFTIPTTNTAPLALRAKWKSPPVAITIGDTAGITGYPPYLVALEEAGVPRNYLRFLWYTAEYFDGSSTPLTLALELTAGTGDIQLRGQTNQAYQSEASLANDTIGPYQGFGSVQTFSQVNIGWSGVNLNFDGLIGEVCIDTKETGCQ